MRSLKVQNVVVFALDSEAIRACRKSHGGGGYAVCLEGQGRTALQKYLIVLLYLYLDRDVFWFDFDSVWLQNPAGALRKAIDAAPNATLHAAIDFDSSDCAMNAFFLIRSSSMSSDALGSIS